MAKPSLFTHQIVPQTTENNKIDDLFGEESQKFIVLNAVYDVHGKTHHQSSENSCGCHN